MKEIPSIIYETVDGKQFVNKDEAKRHEANLTDVQIFLVRYLPDLTEGRGFQKEGLLLVHAKSNRQWFAEHYCYNKFGNRIEFVMGAYGSNAITENWSIHEARAGLPKDVPILDRVEEEFIEKIW